MRANGIEAGEDGVCFCVRLTPRGGRDAVEGWSEAAGGAMYLKARVRVAPESGNANAALIALLAKQLGVGRSAVAIVRGETARRKSVRVRGDGAALARRLRSLGETA